MNKRLITSIFIILGFLVLGAGLGIYTSGYYSSGAKTKPEIQGLLWPNPKQLQTFSLMDDSGNIFKLEHLKDKWSLVFFGFTHCPDICPITLTTLNEVYQKLSGKEISGKLQVLFVSVDPDRDTPEKLSEYVNFFNNDFKGLTGTKEQIDSIGKQIGIVSMKGEETSPGNYTVDHTAAVFLLDPDARWVALFSAPHDTDDMTRRFLAIQQFINQEG